MPRPLPAEDQDLLPEAAVTVPGAELLPGPGVLPVAAGNDAAGILPASARTDLLARASRLLGLDAAVVFTVLARGWSSLAGLVTLTLIARFLSPAEQGYYFTFYSVVALQIVFELGFSVVILQTATHEAAHLTIGQAGVISGPSLAHSRLASVLQKATRWYAVAAVLMAAILLPVGMRFFAGHGAPGQPVAWVGPWVLVVLATVGTFQVDPLFSFLEGCGLVPEVARARLAQAVVGSVLGWAALALHGGLYAPGMMILGQALVGAAFMLSRRRLLVPLLRYPSREQPINWRTEIWPFQWRIAVSWLCGYFTFQLFNPILFAFRGPVEAGQMGMSLSICGTLTSMAIAWMNTKAAPFGRMIALGDFRQLDSTFFRALAQSTAAAITACVGVFGAVEVLRAHGIPVALRLLPPLPLALLLFATVLNIVVFGYALYLRAHKQEKFMWNSIVGALWMAPTALLFGRSHGAMGIASAYAGGSVVIGLGYGSYTFARWRKLWHG